MKWEVIEGDCVEQMARMPEASVDAVVTDPPYHLRFMGRSWDHAPTPAESQVLHLRWTREALRVLKPGGHLLAFGGTRTYHRLACAIEDAGFEIRDSIAWQHMESVFCGCDNLHNGHGDMRGVREGVPDVAEATSAGDGSDVLAPVQRQAPRQGVGDARAQGPSGLDGREPGELPREDNGRAEPGMEGRRDAQAPEGELSRGSLRASAGVGAADGTGGRLRDGASASDGDAGRAAADADGSGASPRSRSGEQRADESRTVAVEWIAQGGGAWPGCPRCGKPLAPPFFGGPLIWEYGSGFPKSLDVSKAIDKAAGAEREVVGPAQWASVRGVSRATTQGASNGGEQGGYNMAAAPDLTAPATPDAQKWQGWGTALKPAHEPVVVARKPLAGTVASNVLERGTGALNIDGCRIEGTKPVMQRTNTVVAANAMAGESTGATSTGEVTTEGRWPANVVLDGEAARLLDEQTGELPSQATRNAPTGARSWHGQGIGGGTLDTYGDSGGASRFFYCAKASSTERNAGLNGFEHKARGSNFGMDGARPHTADDYVYEAKDARNVHPTVKPIELMRWLVRLVTPPRVGGIPYDPENCTVCIGKCDCTGAEPIYQGEPGTVLDPFAGSGTTGCAAVLEKFNFVGIERDPEYIKIARARIAWWTEHPEGMELVRRLEAEREHKAVADSGQLDLLGGVA